MDWLAEYEVDTAERPWDLGEPATLTVIMRLLDTDARSHAFVPVEPTPPGAAQREVILRAMADASPTPAGRHTTRRSRSRASSAATTSSS
jgi:hypothetical protein